MSNSNCRAFLHMYRELMCGWKVSPRGSEVLECEDFVLNLHMDESVLTSFLARNLNLKYAKSEFIWYMRGDPYDTYIEQFASMWPKIKQPAGFYFSNYGKYLFADGQVRWVINELTRDRDSRRESIVLLDQDHIFADNRDMVCTYSMNFRIRRHQLNMSVNMRSNDAIFGTTNDVFSFAMVYEIVYAYLRLTRYPDLCRGLYSHKVDSLHVYQRHWDMLGSILHHGEAGYKHIPVPEILSLSEAEAMLHYHKTKGEGIVCPPAWELMTWLHTDQA